MNRTITRDLIVTIVLLIVGTSTVMTFINARTLMANQRQQIELQADQYVSNLSVSLELPVWTIDRENIRNIAEFYMRSENMAFLKIVDIPDGNVLFDQASNFGTDVVRREGFIQHDKTAIARISLGLDAGGYSKQISELINTTLYTLGIVLLVTTTVTALALRQLLKRPLSELMAGIKRISQGDYNYKLRRAPQKEIQTISKEFTTMAREVQQREQTLRDLNAVLEQEVRERTKIQQETAQLRNQLQSIIDSMPAVLVGVDPDGNITHWNRNAAEVTGTNASNALGQPLLEIFPELGDQGQTIRLAMELGSPRERHKMPWVSEGKTNYRDITVFPLTGGERSGAVILVEDVTAQVRIEEIMVQTEKMMSVGGLAAGMAHEINNPLGGILQSVQNIERRLSPDLSGNISAALEHGISLSAMHAYLKDRKITRMLDGIKESGLRAARIVQNMLNFSRKSSDAIEPHDLNELINDTLELAANDYDLKKHYDFRKIKIIRDFSQDLPPVSCARTEIEQVLLNLVKNAAQAMARFPHTDGTTPCITLRTSQDNVQAVIEVQDNGPGMDEETRRRVFEPFFTTKDPGEGTGLGLSVSFFIITSNHRGEFTVDSLPNRGTRFTIRLPLA